MVYPHTYRTEHSETRTTNSVYGDYYAKLQSKKIPVQPDLLKILQFVDSRRQRFINDLAAAVEIKSITGDLEHRDEFLKMTDFTQKWLDNLAFKYERFNIGEYEINGQKVKLPTIILASLMTGAHKKTLCIYVHIDVNKPNLEKWETDPWKVTEKNDHIYGCGVAQGKGILMMWFHVIEAFQRSNIEIPINLKFIIEGMYHHNSMGLAEFLPLRKQDFCVNIHNVVVCDSEWIGHKHPCIIYGTIGVIHFDLVIEKTEHGGDPRDDMVKIFKEIVDDEERILIPHFDDIVTQITPEEEKMYEDIEEFNVEELRDELPPYRQKWDKVKLLMHYWRLPSIWVGETEECTCEKKDVNIIQRHFIVKIVPRQIMNKTILLVLNHVETVTKKLNIVNNVTCKVGPSTRYWHESVASPNYQAARRATIQVYKEDPSMIKDDKARLNITILDRILEQNILLLPIVSRGSNAGGDNENISLRNFYEGTKLLGAYILQLAK